MARSRVFVSQSTLDDWLSEERVSVEGDVMTVLAESRRFRLTSAVHFVNEVADGGDATKLVGKVKDLDVIASLGGDHCSGSVILGDNAYEVVEGFLGEPLSAEKTDVVAVGGSLAAATAAALGEGPPAGELDLLSAFFQISR